MTATPERISHMLSDVGRWLRIYGPCRGHEVWNRLSASTRETWCAAGLPKHLLWTKNIAAIRRHLVLIGFETED